MQPTPPIRTRPLAVTLSLLVVTATASAGAPMYHLERLEVPDATNVQVSDINSDGQMVGYYLNADFYRQAVMWDIDGTPIPLAMPEGEIDADAKAINDSGQIVGGATDFTFGTSALLWNAGTPDAFLTISSVEGQAAEPQDINNNGVVVGGIGGWQTGAPSRAFSWTLGGGVIDHGVPDENLPDQQARWNAVNAQGTVVGHWNLHSSNVHATIGDASVPAVLPMGGPSEAFPTIATAINDAGVAVGLGLAQDVAMLVPVVFQADGNYTEIPGAVLDQTNGAATAINNGGTIVGTAGIGSAHGAVPGLAAWVHIDGVSYDLYTSVDETGAFESFSRPSAINDDGVIVGIGRLENGDFASFRLTPIAGDGIFADDFELVD